MSTIAPSKGNVRKNCLPSKRFMIDFTIVHAPLPNMDLLSKFGLSERVKWEDYYKMGLASVALTLLHIVCKNTDKIYEEFGVLLFSSSSGDLVMDLIGKISDEKIVLITDVDQDLFADISMREWYAFHGIRILEIDPTGQDTAEKLNVVFLDTNSLYPSTISHFSLLCGYKKGWTILLLQIPPTFPLLRRMDHKGGFSKLMVKCFRNFMTQYRTLFFRA